MKRNLVTIITLGLLSTVSFAQTELTVTVENLQPAGGLFFTPVWVGFHNGTFDSFDVGGMASDALETIAEEGDTMPLSMEFAGMGVDGAVAPGSPFGPSGSSFGSSASSTFSVNGDDYRYFSYASMLIPSNDAFFGNDNPMAYSLFDESGNFTGPLVIDVMGANIYDAGTEMNIANGGAAFSALGGDSVDEAMNIAMHAGLNDFIGTGTANGETISSAFAADTAIARITIAEAIPEPAGWSLVSIALLGLAAVRRRRA